MIPTYISDFVAVGIRDACPNQTVAQVWYTSCMVRYSRINFINQSDSSIAFMLYNPIDAPDPEEYDRKVKILMQNLSYAAGVSNIRSAVAKTSFGTRNIYGYVDCTRDISGSDCTTCLLDAAYAIPSCCSGKGYKSGKIDILSIPLNLSVYFGYFGESNFKELNVVQ